MNAWRCTSPCATTTTPRPGTESCINFISTITIMIDNTYNNNKYICTKLNQTHNNNDES